MYETVDLKRYHRIALLTDGCSTTFLAKTATSLLRYRREDVAAVFDREHAGDDAGELFGVGQGVPVVDTLPPDVDSIFIGIAPPGGHLPEAWHPIICAALRRGIDIVSGLHDFLSDNDEFTALARKHDARLIDVRRNTENDTSSGEPFREGCLRIHTVGHDCSVGKMVAALEVQCELVRRGVDAEFLATGQTGIMISGDGVPVDCVIADFVNGAAERLVRRKESHNVLMIEGQGCISHPSFSAVTLGLLHGCAPHGLIFCLEIGREHVKGLEDVGLLPTRQLIEAYEVAAALREPCKVIGIAVNGRNVSADVAAREQTRLAVEFGVPVCDVYRDGPASLADAVIELQKELFT